MELVLTYALMDAKRRDDYKREQLLSEVDHTWRSFHASQEHKISVFAGRRTGKTYNLALRAANSLYDCMIFTPHQQAVRVIAETIACMPAQTMMTQFIHSTDSARIAYDDGRIIFIRHIHQPAQSMRGEQWINKEIMFDEFDCNEFESILTVMAHRLSQARHIVCVGSMYSNPDSFAKRWFKDSGTRLFIDAPNRPPTRDHRPEEYTPSIYRQLIEHLPPLGVV